MGSPLMHYNHQRNAPGGEMPKPGPRARPLFVMPAPQAGRVEGLGASASLDAVRRAGDRGSRVRGPGSCHEIAAVVLFITFRASIRQLLWRPRIGHCGT